MRGVDTPQQQQQNATAGHRRSLPCVFSCDAEQQAATPRYSYMQTAPAADAAATGQRHRDTQHASTATAAANVTAAAAAATAIGASSIAAAAGAGAGGIGVYVQYKPWIDSFNEL